MNFRFVFPAFFLFLGISQVSAQTAAEYFSLAKTLHSQGRMAEAIAFYEESLNLEPNDPDVLFDRGAAYFTEGQFENAGRDFKKVTILKKHDAEACERLANCYFMQKLYNESIEYYEKSLHIEKSARVQVSCSIARQESGDIDGAVADAEKAIEMDPENPRAWSAKATALFRVGQVETAVTAWREAVQRTPGDAELLANLGAGLCEMGIFREALGWLNKSITLEASAKAYINRAHCFLEMDNLTAALSDIESADQMAPASADVFNIRGLYFLKKNEPEPAIKAFSNAIAWSPNHPNALYNRAQVEYTMGDFREALADLNKLVEQRPKAARAHTHGRGRITSSRNSRPPATISGRRKTWASPVFRTNMAAVFADNDRFLSGFEKIPSKGGRNERGPPFLFPGFFCCKNGPTLRLVWGKNQKAMGRTAAPDFFLFPSKILILYMLNFLLSALLIALFAFFLFSKNAQAQVPYDLGEPDRTIELPAELKEISGLTFTGKKGQLAAIGDEKGQVFFIDEKSGAIERAPVFREKGDFEDLVMLGDSIWCVKSDGDLYKIGDPDETAPAFEKFSSGFLQHERDDVEGLCFDEKNNRLLLACKGVTDSFKVRRFFAFDLKTKQFGPEPVFSLDPCDVEKAMPGGKKGKPFSPSGLAVHPLTGEIYVISSVGKMMAVLSPEGILKQALKLDKELLPQPEGIVFAPDGTLYISSEGKKGTGTILVFKMKK